MSIMHFGASIREILSASCGANLRDASATTPIRELAEDGVRRMLIANLELAFGIEIPSPDAEHWETVRDVLQCVRLRLWEKRAAGSDVVLPADSRPVFVAPPREARERFRRYVPPVPPLVNPTTTTGTKRA